MDSADAFDSLTFTRTEAGRLASLPLAGLRREFPNKMDHVMQGPHDVVSPRECHPAFYGCFDWHSSVHGHWMLVRLLKSFPDLPQAEAVLDLLRDHFTASNLRAEAAYLAHPGRLSFERPYGWAWLLKLAEELRTWDSDEAVEWTQNMEPLTRAVSSRYTDFFPKQTYPIRSGVHSNTAFGLSFALDYARAVGDAQLAELLTGRALDYFAADLNCPAHWEPGGDHFFSPALTEAELMARVLSAEQFANWLTGFLPELSASHPLLTPVHVSDRSDPKIVHLDGLNLSRAWAFRELVRALPEDDSRRPDLLRAALEHARAALEHISSGHYEGEHWLASFAVYFYLGQGRLQR